MRGARMLRRGRKRADERMSESVIVGRFEMLRPPGSLDQVLTLVETFYSGPARVKYPSAAAVVRSPGGQQLTETSIVLSLPSRAPGIATGAMVKVVASVADDSLAGRMYRVDGPAQAGQTTAHRYPVVEES